MRKMLNRLILLMTIFGLFYSSAFADSKNTFDCESSNIKGLVKYSVIGSYKSDFKECSGTIIYDELKKQIKSVRVEIKTNSIHSNCSWCDNIVKSKQLLNAGQYPTIVFEGNDFKDDREGYWVNGSIDLHGVTKDLKSKFTFEEKESGSLVLNGKWILRRKDFNITWNKVLDHGGVLVGDYITVDWEIRAKKI